MTAGHATWQDLRRVARECGEGDEGVDRIERLNPADSAAPHGPILLLGTTDGGLPLVLAQAGGEETRALAALPGRPTFITARSREHRLLKDIFGDHDGAVLVAREPLSAAKSTSLSTDGPFALGVVVTRLSQPLPELDRKLIRSVSRAVAGFVVLVAVLPGEHPTDEEIDQVRSFLLSRLAAEVGDGRVLRLFWCDVAADQTELRVFEDRRISVPLADALDSIPESDLLRAREAACRIEVRRLLAACRERARHLPARILPPLSDDERRIVLADGESYFGQTWSELDRRANEGMLASAARAKEVAATMWRSWTQPRDPGGIWLAYLERLRPGAIASFESAIDNWTPGIEAVSVAKAPRSSNSPSALLGMRVLMSVGFAVAAYAGAEVLLPSVLPLRGMWVSFCFALGALLAWLGTSLWKSAPIPSRVIDAEPSRVELRGGEAIRLRFREWADGILGEQPLDLPGECDRLAAAFGVERPDAGGTGHA